MTELNEISLIRESIYETILNGIDNDALISELENFNLSRLELDEKENKVYGFPASGHQTLLLENSINLLMLGLSGQEMFCREFWMYSMSDTGAAVPRHNHKTNKQLFPEEYFSFAYYPKVSDGCADIYFVGNSCNTIESGIKIKPENSKLLIFHSYIDHYTDRNKSPEKRVCISGNYWPVNPNKTTSSDWSKFMKTEKQQEQVFKFS
jgi:hypothetical protein